MDINSVSNPNMGDATGDINSQSLEGSQNVKTLECESGASKQEQMCFSENSVKKAVILRLTPDGLPPGWIKEIRIQRKANKTRKDPYYTDPVSGYVFRSEKDALRYLETGNFSTCAIKPKKREELEFLNGETSPNMGKLSGGISSSNLEGSQNVKALECTTCVSEQKQTGVTMQSGEKDVIVRVTTKGLPPGWIKEIRIQKKANKTRRDPYYTDPASGYVFRSQKDALRYLETGDISSCATKPTKRDEVKFLNGETSVSLPSAGHYTTRRQLFTGTENNAPSSFETTDAEGSQKRQCTSVSADNGTVSTPSTEILQEENLEKKSIENKRNIKRQCIPKVKKELDLPRRSSKRLEELKLKTVANCVLSEEAHGAAAGKSGETEVKPLQTISTQITDHDLRGTELSDINEKPLEDQAVPEDQPARPETEMKDQENLGSEVNPSGDSWSDPCLEFAFKTLTGALAVENNVATTQGYFQEQVNTSRAQTDGSLALPEFGMPYLPNFFQSNTSPGFDVPGGKPVSVPQLPMNPTYVPPGQPNLGGNNEHQPRVNS
ncbi:hypothetical protein CsSME_00050392 [Camellia sinensis var. sinensis]